MLVATVLRSCLRSIAPDERSTDMAEETGRRRVHERWAHLRFSVIGQLLAAPPDKGELKAAIEALAARTWRHPTTGEPVRFGFSTIERWYYRALNERSDPVGVLRRKLRTNAGQQHAISAAVRRVVIAQYAAHKSWSIKLHHDNLVALAETRPDLKPVPSYPTLRRFMRANGLDKRRRLSPRRTEGAERAETRIVEREVRRYEAEYVNGLWHWDCHHGSRKVLTPRGEWVTPILFGVLAGADCGSRRLRCPMEGLEIAGWARPRRPSRPWAATHDPDRGRACRGQARQGARPGRGGRGGKNPLQLVDPAEMGGAFVGESLSPVRPGLVVIAGRAAGEVEDRHARRAAEAERITDRNHEVADARCMVRKSDIGKVRLPIDLNQGQIGLRVSANDLPRIGGAIVAFDLNCLGMINHMKVGHCISIRRNEEARSSTGNNFMAPEYSVVGHVPEAKLLEEIIEWKI